MMAKWEGSRLTEVPYSFSVLGITTIDGLQVRNPMLALSEQFSASPEGWGFVKYHSGGGCMAYRLDLEDGDYLLLTDSSGSDLPDQPSDYEGAMLGRYSSAGETIALVNVIDIPRRE